MKLGLVVKHQKERERKMPKNKKYIYESPDGGKTIYRREFGNHEKKEKISSGYIEIPEDYWVYES